MTLEKLFVAIVAWRVPLLLLMLSAPWATYPSKDKLKSYQELNSSHQKEATEFYNKKVNINLLFLGN